MNQARVATAILNWNGKKWLEKFLPSVLQTTWNNHAVYVIDNASTDDSVAFLETHYPSIKIVQLQKNHGFAGGYNHGLKQIEADYYAILNSDVEVDPDWIDALVARLESDAEIAAVQPKIKALQPKGSI